MILYSITTKIDPDYAADWLAWQNREQIPEIMALGLFENHELFRLLDQDDEDGYTYNIQFRAANPDDYDLFCRQYRERLNNQAREKWSGHFVSFQSALELVQ